VMATITVGHHHRPEEPGNASDHQNDPGKREKRRRRWNPLPPHARTRADNKISPTHNNTSMPAVAIIAGSKSDQELSDKAAQTLKELGITHDQQTISAHRSPDKLTQYVKRSDAHVYICIAGLSAALPGAVAAYTLKPVIGVPKNAQLQGLDSLLSIAQMPPGVPVATVGIDNARNAALLAAEILALSDPELAKKLVMLREEQARA